MSDIGPHIYLVTKADEIDAIGRHVIQQSGQVDKSGPNVYLAMGYNDLDVDATVNQTRRQPFKMLVSYHYFKKTNLEDVVRRFPERPMIFADSGAYSAHTQGAEVKVADYAAWLKQWRHLFTTYVNLDVIRDPDATATHQRYLEGQGLSPIPVFHTGTDFKVLDELSKTYGYIALGGMVGVPGPTALRWSATCFKRVRDRDTVFHGFGQTRQDVIQALPWFSVDSSSWGKGHRFGQLACWTGRSFVNAKIGDRASIYKVADQIRRYGGDPEDFADRKRYHRSKVIPIAAASWRDFEMFLRRKHGPVALPDRASHLHKFRLPDRPTTDEGTHIYLADTCMEHLEWSAHVAHNREDQP